MAILGDETRPILVAVDETDFVLGYAFCIYQQHVGSQLLTDIKTLYIDDLCVDETRRGQHVGRSLYDAAVALARETGFYESCGLLPQKIGMELIL